MVLIQNDGRTTINTEIKISGAKSRWRNLCFQIFADRNHLRRYPPHLQLHNHLIYDVCVEFAQNYNIATFGRRGSFGCQRRRVAIPRHSSTLAQALDFVQAISYPFAFAPTDRQFIQKHKHSMAAIRLTEIDL